MKCNYKCFPHICYSWAAVENDEKVHFGQVTSREIAHICSETLLSTMDLRISGFSFLLAPYPQPCMIHKKLKS